jgi:hypothetical protein
MPSLYKRVAGQSIERLAASSDGIFAVSMICWFSIYMFRPAKQYILSAICGMHWLRSRLACSSF